MGSNDSSGTVARWEVPSNPLDEAIAAYQECAKQIGVLSITTSGRFVILMKALQGYGNLDEARYNFAFESGLLASAHRHWKEAADVLERTIALDVLVHPETGEHDRTPYVHGDKTPIHPGCVCDGADALRDGDKPFATLDPFHSLPFPEASAEDVVLSERPWRPE